jgi:RNA polymerase sigma-70 factor (ECF subfamily)
MQKIKKGDSASLDELVTLYYPDILNYCLWKTQDRQIAEDATQETFLKLVTHFDGYTYRGKFKAYIYKIAANVCVDFKRKKKEEALPDDLFAYDNRLEQAESKMDFLIILKQLPTEQQEIVLLRFGQELKIREIAEISDLPLRTVQSRLNSALKIMRNLLQGEID